jgi:NADH dehydrogenase
MTDNVVVLGAGYAGAGAIKRLESRLNTEADLTWISKTDYHLVLHESHRCISNPAVQEKITIPVEEIKSPATTFVQGEVVDVDADDRTVELAEASDVEYDYLLVAMGSQTAFFGIDGLAEYAHTLKSLDDALDIHDAIATAAHDATSGEPAQVVIGGAGLSGIQTAGEVAKFRDEESAAIDITLVEGLDSVLPNGPAPLQSKIDDRLRERDVEIITGEFISEVDEELVYYGEDDSIAYDVLVWTGGITGQDAAATIEVDQDERSHRIEAEQTFATSDDRIFAIGDCALIDQPGDEQAPPTAQAAWQAAEVAADNVAHAASGEALETWTYNDMGTVVSIGEDAVAHDTSYMGISLPITKGFMARNLKKAIAAKWIRRITGVERAARAWPDM